jgi:hypothetical protein
MRVGRMLPSMLGKDFKTILLLWALRIECEARGVLLKLNCLAVMSTIE